MNPQEKTPTILNNSIRIPEYPYGVRINKRDMLAVQSSQLGPDKHWMPGAGKHPGEQSSDQQTRGSSDEPCGKHLNQGGSYISVSNIIPVRTQKTRDCVCTIQPWTQRHVCIAIEKREKSYFLLLMILSHWTHRKYGVWSWEYLQA